MNSERPVCGRVLDLHAAARRLRIPERTLRYRAGRGWIEGAFKQGKLWKFPLAALENQKIVFRALIARSERTTHE